MEVVAMLKRSLGVLSLVSLMTTFAMGQLAAKFTYDTGHWLGPHELDPGVAAVVQIGLANTGAEALGVSGVVFDFANPGGGLTIGAFAWEPILDGGIHPDAGVQAFYSAVSPPQTAALLSSDIAGETFYSYPAPEGSFTPGMTIEIATIDVTIDPGLAQATLVAGSASEILTPNEDFPQIIPDNTSEQVVLSADLDGDGWFNDNDNCPCTANPTQLDADGDGFGNICDGDLNQNGVTGLDDFGAFRSCFGSTPASPNWVGNCDAADLNGNNAVGLDDFGTFRGLFGFAPGSGPIGSNCPRFPAP